MQNRYNLVKIRNTKNVISILSSDYYIGNCQFQADFSPIAYVFVFSFIPYFIGIYLVPSITPHSM